MVGDEWPRRSTTGNGVQHRGLHGDKITVVEPSPDERIDLGPGKEDIARLIVHHQVEVPLSETLLGILESEVVAGDLVQAWGKENDFGSGDGQLARVIALALLLLGVRSGGKAAYADDIATTDVYVLRLEVGGIFRHFLGLGEDLQPGALGTEIVEEELGTSRSLDIYPACQLNGLGRVRLAILQVLELVGELAYVVGDVEFVRVCLPLGVELVDGLRSNLEVLQVSVSIPNSGSIWSCLEMMFRPYLVGAKIALVLLGALCFLLGLLCWLLALLLPFLLPLLLALLEFGLGYHLARHLVQMELANGLSGVGDGRGIGPGGIGHDLRSCCLPSISSADFFPCA